MKFREIFVEKALASGRPALYTLRMGRKRRRLVVTITETWTFVFDEAGQQAHDVPIESPALASIPGPAAESTPDASPVAGSFPEVPVAGDTPEQGGSDAGRIEKNGS